MQDRQDPPGRYLQLRHLCRSRAFRIGPRDHPERMSEMHAGASQGLIPCLIPFDFPDKTKEPESLILSNSGSLKAGDERIELPPKVLETPIIPFDQSPVLWPAFASHLYSILRDTSFVKIFSLFLYLFVYKNIPFF